MQEMFRCLERGPEIYLPSKFWQQLNAKNIAELESAGMRNIKRTLAQNYFTWIVGIRSPLFRSIAENTSFSGWVEVLKNLPFYSSESGLGIRRYYELQIFTRLIWLLAESYDSLKFLDRIFEPEFGNPFRVNFRGRLVSQDLANSLMELYAITEIQRPALTEYFTVCELGAGYGRNAFVFLKAFSNCKYIIVDIPPALYVSQAYLSEVLPEKRIMRFKDFTNFEEIREEYEKSDLIFLLPHQAQLLKPKSVEYFVNISSFHEMTFLQIEAYFALVDRLTCGYFYMKQWRNFHNLKDGITVKQTDYPCKDDWKRLYTRTSPSHPLFFETLFHIP